MDIQWIKYFGAGGGVKYLLILPLGVRNHKLVCIDCNKVATREVDLIRSVLPQLSQLTLEQRLIWLKAACPSAVRLGFRELAQTKVEAVTSYTLSGIK
jgi:hypothetical protein